MKKNENVIKRKISEVKDNELDRKTKYVYTCSSRETEPPTFLNFTVSTLRRREFFFSNAITQVNKTVQFRTRR